LCSVGTPVGTQDARRVELRIERDLEQAHGRGAEHVLHAFELTRNERAHLRVGAAGVDEAKDDGVAAQLRDRKRVPALIDERDCRHGIAWLQRRHIHRNRERDCECKCVHHVRMPGAR
jgi:hypothetical protein